MGLREMRTAAHYTQSEVGEKLGVAKSAVSKWESGVAFPHPTKMSILADLYSVSTGEILTACEAAKTQRQLRAG